MIERQLITNPHLLPYFLTEEQAAALCQVARRTIYAWVKSGIWLRGTHWTCPGGTRRRYLRDNIIAWIEERDQVAAEAGPVRTRGKCGLNLAHSPALAAVLEQEQDGM